MGFIVTVPSMYMMHPIRPIFPNSFPSALPAPILPGQKQ